MSWAEKLAARRSTKKEGGKKTSSPTQTATPTLDALGIPPFIGKSQRKGHQRFRKGLVQGGMDPIYGASQRLYNALPEQGRQRGDALNAWLAQRGAPLYQYGPGGVNQQVAEREKAYQAFRAQQGGGGFDPARLAGQVASPATVALGRIAPGITGAPLAGKAVVGAAGGATMGAMEPLVGPDIAGQRERAMQAGGITGGALSLAGPAMARTVVPKTKEAVKNLMKAGVTPTPGQILGGWVKRAEEAIGSLPFVGSAIRKSSRKSIEEMNEVMYRNTLDKVGIPLPRTVKPGHESIDFMEGKLQGAYEELLPKLKGRLDPEFQRVIHAVKQMAQVKRMPQKYKNELVNVIDGEVVDKFTQYGTASGKTVKEMETVLNQVLNGYRGAKDYYRRKVMKDALFEVKAGLHDMLERQNTNAGELFKLNQAYAEFELMRRAAVRPGVKDGVVTPAQLRSAVREFDPTYKKRRSARGKALAQTFSKEAEDVLAPVVADSGTPERAILNAAILGATGATGAVGGLSFGLPTMATLGLLSAPYMAHTRKGVAGLLAGQRPGISGTAPGHSLTPEQIARFLKSPATGVYGAPIGIEAQR